MRKIDPIKKRTKLEMKEGKRSARIAGRSFKKIQKRVQVELADGDRVDAVDLSSERGPLPPTGEIKLPEAVQKQVDIANGYYVRDYAGLVSNLAKYVNQLHTNLLNADPNDTIITRARYEVGYAIVNHLKRFTF